MKRLLCAALLAAACLAPAASAAPASRPGSRPEARPEPANLTRATEGYSFFNRPGADMATHDAELRDCIDGVGIRAMMALTPTAVQPSGLYYDAVRGSFGRINTETCMISRGWRLVRLDIETGRDLAHARREVVVAALKDQVGAERPEGLVVRTWNNEALRGDTLQLTMPAMVMGGLISVRAMDPEAPPPARPIERMVLSQSPRPAPTPYPVLKAADLPAAVPDGSVLVVFHMRGNGSYNGQGYSFVPVAGGPVAPPPQAGDYPRAFYTGLPWSLIPRGRGTPLETVGAVVVPAGRWRLTALMNTMMYCMGSPAFDARPGEVVFLGTIDLSAADTRPVMALEPARQFLAGRPELAAAVQPAAWMNGTTGPCLGAGTYALEFPGYPFVPGYVWGSRAQTGN